MIAGSSQRNILLFAVIFRNISPSSSDAVDEESGVGRDYKGSSTDIAFPQELSVGLRRLYHMRRGPLLSPGPMQSIDDRAESRSYFLRLPLAECLQMMAPTLWSCAATSTPVLTNDTMESGGAIMPYMEDVPPETLALWSNVSSHCRLFAWFLFQFADSVLLTLESIPTYLLSRRNQRIIAADHFHTLFVWSGKDTAQSESDGVRNYLKQFLLDRSIHRFPMPQIHMLQENDSMSRRFTSLLAPSHGDPVEYQLAHFPALAIHLKEHEQLQLRSKFRFHDPASDPSFRNWFWDVTSAVGGSREVGESLCD